MVDLKEATVGYGEFTLGDGSGKHLSEKDNCSPEQL
jgi:hypothetical protein